MRALLLTVLLLLPGLAAAPPLELTSSEVVPVKALAVMSTPEGLRGATSNVSLSFTTPGSGHVFLDTRPLAQVDMQGSARLAVRVASAYTGMPVDDKDFYIVVRGDSPVVGGPSAGGVLAVAAVAALEGWSIRPGSYMTGTINLDGSIGPIGGLPQKAEAAAAEGGSLLVYPAGQEEVREQENPFGPARTVRMAEHCQRLGLRCVPVSDLAEAVAEMTGYQLLNPTPTGAEASPVFREQLQPLAEASVRSARSLLLNATRSYEAASLPRGLRSQLEPALSAASREVFQAEDALASGRPYTASSRAFRATIDASLVLETVHAATAPSSDEAVAALAERAVARADEALANVRDATPRSFADLEAIGAAQERAHEAEGWAGQAKGLAARGALVDAVRLSVQALARADTAAWWHSLAGRDGNGSLTPERVESLARDLVDSAQQTLAYAAVLLGSTSGPSEERLAKARAELDEGLFPAAILDALQAESDASVALSTAGLEEAALQERLNRTLQRADAAIQRARALEVEPFLAQSYLELAEDTVEPGQALALAGLAAALARIPGSLFGTVSATPSRFVGSSTTVEVGPASAPTNLDGLGPVQGFGGGVLVATAGLVGAFGIARAAGRRAHRRQDVESGAPQGGESTPRLESPRPPSPPAPPPDSESFASAMLSVDEAGTQDGPEPSASEAREPGVAQLQPEEAGSRAEI